MVFVNPVEDVVGRVVWQPCGDLVSRPRLRRQAIPFLVLMISVVSVDEISVNNFRFVTTEFTLPREGRKRACEFPGRGPLLDWVTNPRFKSDSYFPPIANQHVAK